MTLAEEMSDALVRLEAGGRLLVAVSGGADSVAALRLALDTGREVVAAHFDHGLREAAKLDAEFVETLCAQLDVKLLSGAAKVASVAEQRGWNLEDAARRLRYEFLHRAAKSSEASAIVVAHTSDDQAETMLMQLLRGSAFPSGMPARRGLVVRPLLGVSRESLREYLQERGQGWREDESNVDTTRTRSWVRHELLPLLERRYPAVAKTLATTAAGLGDAEAALTSIARQVLGEERLLVANLVSLPPALQRAAVAGLLERASAAVNFALVERVRHAVAETAANDGRGAGPWRTSLGHERFVRVAYGAVEVVQRSRRRLEAPRRINTAADWHEAVRELKRTELPPIELVTRHLAAGQGSLVLRHRNPGDYLRLATGRKSLSDLLIDRKVPVEERGALLVLARQAEPKEPGPEEPGPGEADGGKYGPAAEVVWVEGQPLKTAGYAVDDGRTAADLDERFMRQALELAKAAGEAGELPVGALVVRGEQVLAAAGNLSETDNDPAAHAELLALRQAAAVDGDWRLAGATLYVTLEPCPMCFGAVLQTRIVRVVYGADNLREGALGSVMDLRYGAWKRKPTVVRGVLAKESGRLLREFFAGRR